MAHIPKNLVEASEFCTICWKWQVENKKLLPSFQCFIFMQVKPFKITKGMREKFHAIQRAMANLETLKDVPVDGVMVREPRPRVRKSTRNKCVCTVAPTQTAPERAQKSTQALAPALPVVEAATGGADDAEADAEAAPPR